MPMADSSAPDAALVELFRGLRQDARSDPKPAELARVFTIDICFDGAALVPTIGQCVVVPLGPIRGRIVGAAIAANGAGSATIDLRHGTFTDVPSLGQLYGSGGGIPTLTAAAAVILDTSDWTLNLQPNDVLMATLLTVSSVVPAPTIGAMTSLTLSIFCRHLKFPAGTTELTDTGGNAITTAGGATVTLRS